MYTSDTMSLIKNVWNLIFKDRKQVLIKYFGKIATATCIVYNVSVIGSMKRLSNTSLEGKIQLWLQSIYKTPTKIFFRRLPIFTEIVVNLWIDEFIAILTMQDSPVNNWLIMPHSSIISCNAFCSIYLLQKVTYVNKTERFWIFFSSIDIQ